MTCKDCLHYEACKSLLEAMGYTVDGDGENADKRCDTFADRSRYVVREKGEWRNNKDDYPECDKCGYMPQYDPMIDDIYYSDFCPNCGADMTGGDRRV